MSEALPAAELRSVGKRYGKSGGGRWALREVDLRLSFGEVVGFIGPNGAGKTTLIKLLSGLSRATEGEIGVLGQDLRSKCVTPEGVGLVVEHPDFIHYLSGRKNLELLAKIRGVAEEKDIASALRTVGLDPADCRPTRAYSLGMRQRLGLAQALMEKPRLLLLDEPTNGLDPAGIIQLRGLIRRLSETGVAVFMASHLLTEVEQVCDRVMLVREGRLVKELSKEQSRAAPMLRLTVSTEADIAALLKWAQQVQATVKPVDGFPLVLNVITDRPTPQVVRKLVEAGINIEELTKVHRTLEQEFMALVGPSPP